MKYCKSENVNSLQTYTTPTDVPEWQRHLSGQITEDATAETAVAAEAADAADAAETAEAADASSEEISHKAGTAPATDSLEGDRRLFI